MSRTVAIIAMLFFCVTGTGTASPLALKMNHQFPETAPGSRIDQWFADQVNRRTKGEVTIRIFWSNGLGDPRDNLSLISRGVLDMAAMSPGYFPEKMPLTAAPNSIPMAMENVCQASAIMPALLEQVPAVSREHENLGIKALFFHVLSPYYLVSRDPIVRLADLKGKRIRTWGDDMPKIVLAAGAKPVPLFLPDVYPAMEKGIINACPFSLDLMETYHIYRLARNVTRVILWEGPSWGVWISRAAWERLSPAHREILMAAASEARQRELDMVIEDENRARLYLLENGVRFHDFPREDLATWKAHAPDFFSLLIQKMTARGQGEAAETAVGLWKKIRRETDCP